MMRNFLLLLFTFPLISHGQGNSSDFSSRVLDSELQSVSEVLFSLDSNSASESELIINPQTLIEQSVSSTANDLSPLPLFEYVDECVLRRPTYAALISLLNNYERRTGVSENVTSSHIQEQHTFLTHCMNTELGQQLYSFFYTKGYYSSWEEFLYDLRMMWFGLYSRSSGHLDSSGFEHIFAGEIKNKKVSGFHNWVRFYLLEKSRLLNYYSHSYDGPWTWYPDVLGLQFLWDGYYKPLGSALIGSSPELELSIYTLCYVTRPGKHCRLRLGGKALTIQTHSWDKVTYGDGRKYIGSAYPITP